MQSNSLSYTCDSGEQPIRTEVVPAFKKAHSVSVSFQSVNMLYYYLVSKFCLKPQEIFSQLQSNKSVNEGNFFQILESKQFKIQQKRKEGVLVQWAQFSLQIRCVFSVDCFHLDPAVEL